MSAAETSADRMLVIVPTYNEAPNVIGLSSEVLRQDARLEVLVVDDASPDGTSELVEAAMRTEPRLHLLRRDGKLGLGTAYLAGFQYGLDRDFAYLFTMDCDFSHNPRYLPALITALEHDDVVIGSRYVPGGGIENWPWYRRLLSRFANFYTRTLLSLDVRDCTAGFRGYRREAIELIDPFQIRSSGYSFLEEIVWRVDRCGLRIGEIPIVFEERRAGRSKIESREIYRAAWFVLMTAFERAPRCRDPGSSGPPSDNAERPRSGST